MAPTKASMGTTRWYSPDGTNWSEDRRLVNGINLWRIGTPAAIEALAGKVIRGWTIKGQVFGPIRRAIEIVGLQGCSYPQPSQILTGLSRTFDMVRADTGRPIGAIPLFGDFNVVGSQEWVGLYSTNFVTRRESDSIPYPVLTEFTLLVSPKPRWKVEAPAEVEVGSIVEVKVHVAYADGENIVGLLLAMRSGAGRTEVRGATSTFGPSATALTNAQGVATFRLRGLTGGSEHVWVSDSPHVNLREPLYDPSLPGQFNISVRDVVVALPPGECVDIPAVPEIPEIPARIEFESTFQWDAGGNSVAELDGDLHVVFDQGYGVGTVLGFAGSRDDVGTYARITHAFYFHATAAGQFRVAVMEAGKTVSSPMPHVAAAQYEIRRVGGAVSYLIDDVVVYQSRVSSTGPVVVGTALYATGDSAP
ncbi:hypothetical protein [Luteimonas saliphila]|uniref:hypothetical protein n=1 Tax=Luteimonas saliphila TaxID=2804919 RepID=UPI001EE26D32|nr:hypothetical protein [Luteimonas saliphila]